MLNKKRIVTIILALVMVLSLVGCSGDKNVEPVEDTNVNSNVPSAILLIPGNLGDKSFLDSANNGMTLIKENYGCETKVVEMGLDFTKYTSIFEDSIDEGWDLIITGGINVSGPLQEIAEKYPEQKFILYDEAVDYSDGKNANILSITYKANEGAYLMGALGALVTASDMEKANPEKQIGFVGGFDIPLINDFLVGYIQGAQYIDPETKVGFGYASAFTDAAKGKEIALALYNGGADVIMQAAGGTGIGVIDAAKEKGKYALGTDSDQAEMFSDDPEKANSILCSLLKRVDESINRSVKSYIDGSIAFGTAVQYGISDGCVALTDQNKWYTENVQEDIRTQIDDLYTKVKDGEIQVKSIFEYSDQEWKQLKETVTP